MILNVAFLSKYVFVDSFQVLATCSSSSRYVLLASSNYFYLKLKVDYFELRSIKD